MKIIEKLVLYCTILIINMESHNNLIIDAPYVLYFADNSFNYTKLNIRCKSLYKPIKIVYSNQPFNDIYFSYNNYYIINDIINSFTIYPCKNLKMLFLNDNIIYDNHTTYMTIKFENNVIHNFSNVIIDDVRNFHSISIKPVITITDITNEIDNVDFIVNALNNIVL